MSVVTFTRGDDVAVLPELVSRVDAVVHLAGENRPADEAAFAQVNTGLTAELCKSIKKVFQSTGRNVPLVLASSTQAERDNPYGRSKLIIEQMLGDLAQSDPSWRIALLRYFNPVGANESGLIGEEPNGIPNNLVPYIAQVADGRRAHLSVYGGDYPTPDGTGVRDYIHVVDLALGHVKTLDKLATGPGVVTYNLGTGRGNSVLEMVREFERACGKAIPYQIVARRPGDIAACYADPTLAETELGWKAERGIAQMCADSWRWQSQPK